MTDRPILFSGPMVRAILDGSKTQTRRVVKPQPASGARSSPFVPSGIEDGHGRAIVCPYGAPGDRLWVRETWQSCGTGPYEDGCAIRYRADDTIRVQRFDPGADGPAPAPTKAWRPSIHMPRWASRLTLEVLGVRVERLQAITEEDARAEGTPRNDIGRFLPPYPNTAGWMHALDAFPGWWDAFNGRRPGCSWEANPWVWVVSFRRLP